MEILFLKFWKGYITMEKMSFNTSMKRLEEIVSLLEKNEIELEDAMVLFEEGLQLVNTCTKQLTQFENKVQSLLDTYQQEGGN